MQPLPTPQAQRERRHLPPTAVLWRRRHRQCLPLAAGRRGGTDRIQRGRLVALAVSPPPPPPRRRRVPVLAPPWQGLGTVPQRPRCRARPVAPASWRLCTQTKVVGAGARVLCGIPGGAGRGARVLPLQCGRVSSTWPGGRVVAGVGTAPRAAGAARRWPCRHPGLRPSLRCSSRRGRCAGGERGGTGGSQRSRSAGDVSPWGALPRSTPHDMSSWPCRDPPEAQGGPDGNP
jgi:hypothetical protein